MIASTVNQHRMLRWTKNRTWIQAMNRFSFLPYERGPASLFKLRGTESAKHPMVNHNSCRGRERSGFWKIVDFPTLRLLGRAPGGVCSGWELIRAEWKNSDDTKHMSPWREIITAIQTHLVCQTSCDRWKLIKILIGPLSWATVIVFLVTSVPTLVASSVKCVRSTYSVPGPFFFQTIPINSLPMGGTFLVCETWRHFRESEWD
jgi:hypothetical protein